ncbi:MAG: hypothetical protein WHX53_11435 [Anaerolineae bacterium]
MMFRNEIHAAAGGTADENCTAEAQCRGAAALRPYLSAVIFSAAQARGLRYIFLLALIAALMPWTAAAENLGPGGGTRVIAGDEVVGPYRLFVTSSPEPAQIGPVTIAVRVGDGKSDEKIRDAQVRITLTLPGSNVRLEAAATHADAGNPIDYAAHIQIDQPGLYEGTIRIEAAQGPAELRFTQRILPPRTTSTLLVLALPFVAALLILAGFWYFRSTTHATAQR